MRVWALCLAAVCAASAFAQPGVLTRELLIQYTPDWKGERFADGRPKVPDGILERLKSVTREEAWAQLRTAGFNQEYEDGWFSIHPDKVLVGRALTGPWLPGRPAVHFPFIFPFPLGAVIDLERVGDAVGVEDVMQLARVDTQPVLIADVDRDGAVLPQVPEVLVDERERRVGCSFRDHILADLSALDRQVEVERRLFRIRRPGGRRGKLGAETEWQPGGVGRPRA